MRLSFVYHTPVPLLQLMISSREFTRLMVAAKLGLVPDPTRQPAIQAAAAHNGGIVAGLMTAAAFAGCTSDGPAFHTEDDYLLKDRKGQPPTKTRSKVLTAQESERLAAERWS